MARRRTTTRNLVSPLASWFGDDSAVRGLRRRLGRGRVLLPPRDRHWRDLAPDFAGAVALAASGVPFQVAADRRYDRSGDPRRLRRALAEGKTVFLPQVHQVLPRLARLMVALRTTFFPSLGTPREECSFLFVVEGRGRPGMGLHHDGDVDLFWLQLAGRRTVTLGPRVPPGSPADLDESLAPAGSPGSWETRDLAPGTLLYLPPRTPHAVSCRTRSLAVSMSWRRPRHTPGRPPRTAREARGVTAWDVVSGYAAPVPRPSHRMLWTQIPVATGPPGRARDDFPLWTSDGEALRLPGTARRLAGRLGPMPRVSRTLIDRLGAAGRHLIEHGILAPRDLPVRIVPDHPDSLDGWRFA